MRQRGMKKGGEVERLFGRGEGGASRSRATSRALEYYKQRTFQGDNKAQEETRHGDVVQGSYSLIEPDGARRVVSYAADPINGFNAVVQRDPTHVTIKSAAVAAAPAIVAPTHGRKQRCVFTAAASPATAAAVAVHPQVSNADYALADADGRCFFLFFFPRPVPFSFPCPLAQGGLSFPLS